MYIIRKALHSDVDKILDVLNSVLLQNLPSKNNGFLTYNPGKRFYKKLIEIADFVYVVCYKKDIIGFLVAYPSSMLNPKDEIQKFLINHYKKEEFIYIFQLAVTPKYHRNGIGKKLYKQLFMDAKKIKKIVVTSAVPYNRASEKFNLILGFTKKGKILRSDGGSNFVYENIKNYIR
ncbi:MAG: GNAT family N-acetyltransferase [Candidatus Magasanikbacteria bacterium]